MMHGMTKTLPNSTDAVTDKLPLGLELTPAAASLASMMLARMLRVSSR